MTPSHKPDIRQANPCPPCPKHATLWDKLIYLLGIGLGSGLAKRAAGTWGTVAGLIVAIPLFSFGFYPFFIFVIIAGLFASYTCGHTSKLMNVHDDPHIVFDEWIGIWISILPVLYHQAHHISQYQPAFWGLLLIAFVVFRFFDIVKPFPINWVDRHSKGGFGILIDDVLAGLITMIIMQGIIYLLY